jgi:hypothetical protein
MSHLPGSAQNEHRTRSAAELSDMDIEKPAGDAVEQEREVVETDEDDEDPVPQISEIPLDANEADVVEQEETVETDDDDDYR